jgi:hypothetical protein
MKTVLVCQPTGDQEITHDPTQKKTVNTEILIARSMSLRAHAPRPRLLLPTCNMCVRASDPFFSSCMRGPTPGMDGSGRSPSDLHTQSHKRVNISMIPAHKTRSPALGHPWPLINRKSPEANARRQRPDARKDVCVCVSCPF